MAVGLPGCSVLAGGSMSGSLLCGSDVVFPQAYFVLLKGDAMCVGPEL